MPILSKNFYNFKNNIDSSRSILYNSQVSDSFSFGNMKKSDNKPMNNEEKNFLNDFIKKYNIEFRVKKIAKANLEHTREYSDNVKDSFNVREPDNLKVSNKIKYEVYPLCIVSKIDILENNKKKFVCNVEFNKYGSVNDTWYSKN